MSAPEVRLRSDVSDTSASTIDDTPEDFNCGLERLDIDVDEATHRPGGGGDFLVAHRISGFFELTRAQSNLVEPSSSPQSLERANSAT